MTVEDIMPPFDLNKVAEQFERKTRRWYERRAVDKTTLIHPERTASVPQDDSWLWVGNHQTQLDYFVPGYVALANLLPYPRMVSGNNLGHPLIRKMMFDFSQWGVIWHDRNDMSNQAKRDLLGAFEKSFAEGYSIGGFPEGTRNREIGGEPKEFAEGFFSAALWAQRRTGKPIKVVCFALDYDRIPEEGFYDKIDSNRGRFGYFGWDVYANLRWQYAIRHRGEVRVNIGEPIPILELAGGEKKKSETLAHETRRIVTELLHEAKTYRER